MTLFLGQQFGADDGPLPFNVSGRRIADGGGRRGRTTTPHQKTDTNDPQQPIAPSLPASLDNNIPDAQLERSGGLNDL